VMLESEARPLATATTAATPASPLAS